MALTTLANVKSWLEIDTLVTTNDAILTRLIDSCSSYIESWLNRKILQGTYTENYDGRGGNAITLAQYPITALTSVSIDGVAQTILASTETTKTGVRYVDRQLVINGDVFPRGRGNIAVVYTAGYSSAPSDIEQACIELVSLRYKNGRGNRLGVKSKNLAGEHVLFFDGDMADSTKELLLQWRNVVIG